MWIPVAILVLVWGFVVIPALFKELAKAGNAMVFYYLFPIFTFMVRIIMYTAYRWIGETSYLFIQLPMFLLGLEYGVMLTLSIGNIEFWYLMVFFTLQIVNDRTQFTTLTMVSIHKSCIHSRKSSKKKSSNEVQPTMYHSSS